MKSINSRPQRSWLGSLVQYFINHLEAEAVGNEISRFFFPVKNELSLVPYRWNKVSKDLGSEYENITST